MSHITGGTKGGKCSLKKKTKDIADDQSSKFNRLTTNYRAYTSNLKLVNEKDDT